MSSSRQHAQSRLANVLFIKRVSLMSQKGCWQSRRRVERTLALVHSIYSRMLMSRTRTLRQSYHGARITNTAALLATAMARTIRALPPVRKRHSSAMGHGRNRDRRRAGSQPVALVALQSKLGRSDSARPTAVSRKTGRLTAGSSCPRRARASHAVKGNRRTVLQRARSIPWLLDVRRRAVSAARAR